VSQEDDDAKLMSSVIDSMRQGCGCARLHLNSEACRDARCPNSPAWGGLIQFGMPDAQGNWREPGVKEILEGDPTDPHPFDGLPSRSMVPTDQGNRLEDPAWRELGNAHRVLRVAAGESIASIARRRGIPERAVVDMEHGRENPDVLLEPLFAQLRANQSDRWHVPFFDLK